jgi:Mg-chelatase subunit ChlD
MTKVEISGPASEILDVTIYSSPSIRSNVIQNVEICVEVNIKNVKINEHMRLGVVLIIDRSGSMKGKLLEGAILSGKTVVDKMTPNDSLCVLSFSDTVETVIPLQRVINKESLKSKLELIQPEGGTNMMKALLEGIRTLSSSSSGISKKLILLLSDGVPDSSLGLDVISGLEREHG